MTKSKFSNHEKLQPPKYPNKWSTNISVKLFYKMPEIFLEL